MTFHSLDLIEPIIKAVEKQGYKAPTPIQEQSIPLILKGKDILGCAQTGTGKTAAFSIPILQLLEQKKTGTTKRRRIRGLIVTPTRELAIQIGESFEAYGQFTGIKHTVIFGGVKQTKQVARLKAGVDVLIATPGRLLDLIDQKLLTIKDVEMFVLDEADRMLDMGFIHDIKRLLKLLPAQRQSLFFSATMPNNIMKLADNILNRPEKVSVAPVSSTVDIIEQYVYFVDKPNKSFLLLDLLKDERIDSVLIFTRTKHGADKVVRHLKKKNIRAEAIHGNKSQNARQAALKNFKSKTTRVLVATDIAARGIDVDRLKYVINFDLPNVSETYVHRIGRTGRAGREGISYSFCDAIEKEYLRDIEKLIKKQLTVVDDHAFPLMDLNPPKPQQQQRQAKRAPRKKTASGVGPKAHRAAPKKGKRKSYAN